MKTLLLALLAGLAVCPASRAANTGFSVNMIGTPTAQALIFDGVHSSVDLHSLTVNTGDLAQTSLSSGLISVSARGHAMDFSRGLDIPQESDVGFDARVSIGELHVTAFADSNTGGFVTSSQTKGVLNTLTMSWSDTVTFHTSNPNGSDFLLGLTMHDTISVSASFLAPPSFVAGTATAGLSSGPGGVSGLLLLSLQDVVSERFSGDVVSHPPSDTVSTLMHMQNGATLQLTGWLRISVAANDAIGSVSLDAADTALFSLRSDDPLAGYSTASGTVFVTGVPEPATSALALAGLGFVSWQARRRPRQRPAALS